MLHPFSESVSPVSLSPLLFHDPFFPLKPGFPLSATHDIKPKAQWNVRATKYVMLLVTAPPKIYTLSCLHGLSLDCFLL